MLNNIFKLFLATLVFISYSCDTDDLSRSDDHPRFADTSNIKHDQTSSQNAATIGGTVSGATNNSKSYNFENYLTTQETSFISECENNSKTEMKINKENKTLEEIHYYYDTRADSSDLCNSKLYEMSYSILYRYTLTGKTFKSSSIVTLDLVSGSATVYTPEFAESSSTIGLFDIKDWKANEKRDITSYLKIFFLDSMDYLIKIDDNNFYWDPYFKDVMPNNYDIKVKGEKFTKSN